MESVAIGMIVGEDRVRVETLVSLLDLLSRPMADVRIAGRLITRASPDVSVGRNLVVEGLLDETTADWLLFVDADAAFTPGDVDRLVASAHRERRPLVSGLYFQASPFGHLSPTVYERGPDGGYRTMMRYQPNAVVPCDAFGAGFMLCHRQVFVAMRGRHSPAAPWFDISYTEDGAYRLGEDQTFCARAQTLGVQPYVNTGVRVGHVKSIVVTEQSYRSIAQRPA